MVPPPLGKSAKKKGLAALAAAALASPVAGAPAGAQDPRAVSPQPSAREGTKTDIRERMGTGSERLPRQGDRAIDGIPGEIPMTPDGHAIGPSCTPKDPSAEPTAAGAESEAKKKVQHAPAQPALEPGAQPAVKDKALVYTGPSKPGGSPAKDKSLIVIAPQKPSE